MCFTSAYQVFAFHLLVRALELGNLTEICGVQRRRFRCMFGCLILEIYQDDTHVYCFNL